MQDMAVHPTKEDRRGGQPPARWPVQASRADRIVEHRYECKDRQLTGFSNEEETQAGFSGNAPWLLEDRLRISGARYIAKAPWTPHAVVDGNLVTGQQNYSASVTADAVLKQLAVQKQVAATI